MTAEQLKVIAEVIAEWDAILSSPPPPPQHFLTRLVEVRIVRTILTCS